MVYAVSNTKVTPIMFETKPDIYMDSVEFLDLLVKDKIKELLSLGNKDTIVVKCMGTEVEDALYEVNTSNLTVELPPSKRKGMGILGIL